MPLLNARKRAATFNDVAALLVKVVAYAEW